MGKGGTKFVADAIGARSGRSKRLSAKERAKDMATFLETGVREVHPELAEAVRTRGPVKATLPPPSPLRPYVFLQFSVGKKIIGKVVIEVFDDIVPTAAKYFISRCLAGSTGSAEDCLMGKRVTRVLRGVCFVCDINKIPDNATRVSPKAEPSLRHCEQGSVSLRCDGNDLCIALAATLPQYDVTHQVIGRVIQTSIDVVENIADVLTTADDQPAKTIIISRTGKTDAHGEVEIDVLDAERKPGDGSDSAFKSEDVQQSVLEALAVGSKRSAQKSEDMKRHSSKKKVLDRYLIGEDNEYASSSEGEDS